ncbi:hypothetical protein [Methylophilus luteus]|uniref:Uncharacterized protein n=1 Tax=Methylophilus luteus TaxID=640108 RepID=A0ABW3F5Z1_9PROT
MNVDNYVKDAPSSLDGIVRQHRNELRLSTASELDLAQISKTFLISNLRGILRSGFIYKWEFLLVGVANLYIVGHRVGAPDTQGLHSSRIIAYDPEINVVLTQSGSHYILEEFIDPDSDRWLLLHICNWMHGEYAGKYYGVPKVKIFQ